MTESDWPIVAVNDDGIRTACGPNRCAYCQQPVGSPHGAECVIVTKRVKLRAVIEYEVDLPYFWQQEDIESHRNESGWCQNNVLDEIKKYGDEVGCLCNSCKISFVEIVDATPKRELKA